MQILQTFSETVRILASSIICPCSIRRLNSHAQKNCTSMILVTGPPPKPPNLNRHCQGRRNSGGHDAWTWIFSNPWMPNGEDPKTPTEKVDETWILIIQIDAKYQRFLSHEISGCWKNYRASVLTCLLGSWFFSPMFYFWEDPSLTYRAVWWIEIDHWAHEAMRWSFFFGWPESRRIKKWWQKIWWF